MDVQLPPGSSQGRHCTRWGVWGTEAAWAEAMASRMGRSGHTLGLCGWCSLVATELVSCSCCKKLLQNGGLDNRHTIILEMGGSFRWL